MERIAEREEERVKEDNDSRTRLEGNRRRDYTIAGKL